MFGLRPVPRKVVFSKGSVDNGKIFRVRMPEAECDIEKGHGNTKGRPPEKVGVVVDIAGEILFGRTVPRFARYTASHPAQGVVAGIQQLSQGDIYQFFDLPIGKKPLLTGNPADHGIDVPFKHGKLLGGQGAQERDPRRIHPHLLETLP